jgi:RepB DNA-primase from phage plasmid/Primase C terminal 2 (PriCT-2)
MQCADTTRQQLASNFNLALQTSAGPAINAATVRAHVALIHEHAARLCAGVRNPGHLQLSRIHPGHPGIRVTRYRIGDIEGMVKDAIAASEAGHNSYVEPRCVRPDLRGNARGSLEDTSFVFALVVDSDADKGKASKLQLEPSLVVETSSGNQHRWFLLDRAIGPKQAQALGDRLRLAAEADAATGTVTQPYRLAGTPNFLSRTKRARGRVTVPTRLLAHSGRLYSPDELDAVLPLLPLLRGAISNGEIDAADGLPPLPPRRIATGNCEIELTYNIDVALIHAALDCIPNPPEKPQEWDVWFSVVLACHHASIHAATPEIKRAITIACINWSKQAGDWRNGGKYNSNNQRKLWEGLERKARSHRKVATPITIGTLYRIANRYDFDPAAVDRAFCDACWRILEKATFAKLTPEDHFIAFGF